MFDRRKRGSPDGEKHPPGGSSRNMPVWKPSSELMRALVESERPRAPSPSEEPPPVPAIPSLGVPAIDEASESAETALRPGPAPDPTLPSPELLEAMLKEGGARPPSSRPPTDPPLPKVTGLPDLSHADADEQGLTRLRPSSRPPGPDASGDAETLLYVKHVSSSPAPRLARSTPPEPAPAPRRSGWKTFLIVVAWALALGVIGAALGAAYALWLRR